MKTDRKHLGDTLSKLRPVATKEVLILLKSMSGKNSPLDTIPTVLLNKSADIFSNHQSPSKSLVPPKSLPGQIQEGASDAINQEGWPGPRGPCQLPTNIKPLNYLQGARMFISVAAQRPYLAMFKFHSISIGLQTVPQILNTTADGQRSTCLVALDLSAAFDTLDHDTITDRLRHTFGIESSAIDWITSYLTNRSQFVKFGDIMSPPTNCSIGVPQGSVLGPILFSLFISPLAGVISNFGVFFHQFADDTQLCIGLDPLDILGKCSLAVLGWFTNNGLALNPSKSEVLFMGTRTKLHSVGNIAKVSVTGCDISPAGSIKSLRVTLDSELSLSKHVSNICKTSHYHIRALRHIRQSVDLETAKTIGCAIVGSRLDYCNSILYGISAGNLKKLQTLQNALARVVSRKRKYDRITPTHQH